MLDIKLIRENPDIIRKDLEKRKDNEKIKLVDELITKDEELRTIMKEVQDLRSKRNKISQDIKDLKKQGKDASEVLEEAKNIPGKIKEIEEKEKELKIFVRNGLMSLPNIMHETVPYGKDDSENVEIKKWGEPRTFDFDLKSHGEAAEKLGIANFKKAAEVSGAGFYYLFGDLAMLNNALLQYAIDFLVKKGYEFVIPPLMLNRKAYEGVTDLSDFENVMYKINDEDLYMIATAEHPIGALYMNEVINETNLPLKMVGSSPCFRKEIGSRGVDTKGLFRVHQFWKVEQFIFCKPEDSWKLHEELLDNTEQLFQGLGLPYRIVNICTGDLGIIASKKYDLEVWMPRQNAYKEAASCSNCTDYQARRLNIKFGKEGGNKELLHTLNNTGIATSRAMVAILENYQNSDGTITIPEVLKPYMHGKEKIEKQ